MLATRMTLFLTVLMLSAGQVDAFETRIEVTPQDGTNEISVVVTDPTPPSSFWGFVGYAVVRYMHLQCVDPVFISEIINFSDPITVTDTSPPDYCAYTYIAALIDGDGVPQRNSGWHSIETMGGLEHPILRGDLRSGGTFGGGQVFLCPEICTGTLSLKTYVGLSGGAPDELIDARDTGQVFDIYGAIDYYFEGPFLTLVSEVAPTTCEAEVATRKLTWSALKAQFR